MYSVIFEVVVDRALAEAVVLVGVLDNWLLEVSTEVKHLHIRVIVMHIIVLIIALI